MRRCAGCGCWEYGGAPGCDRCAALVDRIVEDGWRVFLRDRFGVAGLPAEEESAIAEMVADEPDRHDWRVVDGALDRLPAPAAGPRWAGGHGAARRATSPTASATRRSRPTARTSHPATSTRSGSASR
ncbi:hypothetical protein ABT061_26300 [Streptosporangium sp. NPDC002544]|uniref:hypothetical protein n=1 Tax=Streptosporangium sp. NPDC002544 TaxID=3154538 RepID=UPI0033301744